ncbi:glycosyltransferase family 2 protein [Spirosoma montaniterrae]|uniref:Glycosyl transferase family 2 n=1 Tax=Spirosoma montaniterrae TaxID=1178516 RepID=A0A1P9X1U7_9BACT|nr:glycosyltransferase family 2 protein [Spirosoma montaniterrae]AQG81597.1 glycosyl transferase family 2 [Spirosoma montaniterrae]
MKVSVLIITYNQAKFIRKAIDSALAQQTTFPIEILVGDDFSSDGTREIIQEYERAHPGLVIGVLHPHNMGKNGGINFLETLKRAKGEYYALMDGDDYWTDSLKLQKQADLLDAHPDYSTVFHNAVITYEDGTPSHLLNGPDMKPYYTVDDLIGEDEIWFMATSSTMYRNNISEYPTWFRESSSGDIPRLILKAKLGKIGYIPDVMSVYRKNRGGASYADNYFDETFLRNRIQMYTDINRELDYKYDRVLRRNIARYYRMMLDARQYKQSYFRRAGLALKYLYMAQPDWDKAKDVVWTYLLPEPMRKLYSSIRLMPHRQ